MKTTRDIIEFLNTCELEIIDRDNAFKYRYVISGFDEIKRFLIEFYVMEGFKSETESLFKSINEVLLDILNNECDREIVLKIAMFENEFITFMYETGKCSNDSSE